MNEAENRYVYDVRWTISQLVADAHATCNYISGELDKDDTMRNMREIRESIDSLREMLDGIMARDMQRKLYMRGEL